MKKSSILFLGAILLALVVSSCGRPTQREMDAALLQQHLTDSIAAADANQGALALIGMMKDEGTQLRKTNRALNGEKLALAADVKKEVGKKWYYHSQLKKADAKFDAFAEEEAAAKEKLAASIEQLESNLDSMTTAYELSEASYGLLGEKLLATQDTLRERTELIEYGIVNSLSFAKRVSKTAECGGFYFNGKASWWIRTFTKEKTIESVCSK